MKILFCINIFFVLLDAIAGDSDYFNMTLEERKDLFDNEDGSIPEHRVVDVVLPSKSKRSANEPLTITFNAFGDYLTTTVYAVEDHDLINRGITGVWAAISSEHAYQNVIYSPWPAIFDEIGEIEFYQNAKEGSAITRFRDANGDEHIMGILKQNYTAKSIPRKYENAFIDISRKHSLTRRSSDSLNDQDEKRLSVLVFKNNAEPEKLVRRHIYAKNEAFSDHRAKRDSEDSAEVPDVVYPKLLLIIEANVLRRYGNYLDVLKQLIARFNSIAMMFRQLKEPEVHLSITGIIIAWDDWATPYIQGHTYPDLRINGDAATNDAQLYFNNEPRRFSRDWWDSAVMFTTNPIGTLGYETGDLVIVNGLGPLAQGCAGAVAIAKFTENMDSVYTLAHELGHLFGVSHDEEEDASGKCKDADGYLMANGYGFAEKLDWSSCSRAAFRKFFSSPAGNCTYEPPEAVPEAVENLPGAWLSIDGQCDNVYKDSTDFCMSDDPDCFAYGCLRKDDEDCDWVLAPPMDGSFMDDNDNGSKACVNRTWIPL